MGPLPRETALRALTPAAAEILGVANRFGSIEPGETANRILTDGTCSKCARVRLF